MVKHISHTEAARLIRRDAGDPKLGQRSFARVKEYLQNRFGEQLAYFLREGHLLFSNRDGVITISHYTEARA